MRVSEYVPESFYETPGWNGTIRSNRNYQDEIVLGNPVQ
jgi:hypothetical protein